MGIIGKLTFDVELQAIDDLSFNFTELRDSVGPIYETGTKNKIGIVTA